MIEETPSVSSTVVKSSNAVPKHKRFRTAQLHTNKLADVISDQTGQLYHNKLIQLRELINYWTSGSEVSIQPVLCDDG